MTFHQEKQLVRAMYAEISAADPARIGFVLSNYMTSDALWRGYHPFNEIIGPENVAEQFWMPLKRSLTRMQRRQDIFFAGRNEIDEAPGVWVVSMGHLMGLFDASWLGIAATSKMAFLRYCEFHRVVDGAITETAMFFDIPHLMMQTGLQPFPPQTAAHLVQPGPMTHDGLLFEDAPEHEGVETRRAINAMITDLGTWQLGLPLEDELRRTWHDDMIWWGPAGIGASYSIERYAKQHSGPFRAAFSERSTTGHVARVAEGHYGGFFGWPNFTAVHTGGFMGMPASEKRGEMRVIDIYRRQDDKLAENWIFIDLLHFWKMLGVDILERMRTVPRT